MRWGFNPKLIRHKRSYIMSHLPRELVLSGSIIIRDEEYEVPVSPEYIMRAVPSWRKEYIPGKRNCKGFVRILLGWLSGKGFGDVLAMDAEVLRNPNDAKKHNLIAFIDLTRVDKQDRHPLIFGEPQTGLLIDKVISDRYTEIELRS